MSYEIMSVPFVFSGRMDKVDSSVGIKEKDKTK